MSNSDDSLLCPITFQLFRDPVLAQDGHTYEREAIVKWIEHGGRSPLTDQPLSLEHLYPNYAIKKAVDCFEKASKNVDYRYRLNVDVKKKAGRPLFQTFGKTIYHAEWLPTNNNHPEMILLKIDGVRIEKEASFYVSLSSHPHIVRTYGVVYDENDNENNTAMLLQEYAPMGSLYELLKERKEILSENILVEIFLQIIDAMIFLLMHDVVHGNLACRNILVFGFDENYPKNNIVKITDFGLSRYSKIYSIKSGAGKTTLNMISVRYSAPELVSSNLSQNDYTEKSDVYSMGILMWEAYSRGALPWSKIINDNDVIQCIINGECLPKPSNCSEPYWSIICKTWEKLPENRPTFIELRDLFIKQNSDTKSKASNIDQSIEIAQDPDDTVVDLTQYRQENQQLIEQYTDLVEQLKAKEIVSEIDFASDDRETFKALIKLAEKTPLIEMKSNTFAFFGLPSAGKSTIINKLLNIKVTETDHEETTIRLYCYPGTKFFIYDMSGRKNDISYFSMEYIGFWKGLSRRIILITSTVKEMSYVCQLLDGLKLDYDIVVNKCDRIGDEKERVKFKKQIYKEIEDLQLKHVCTDRVYFVSATKPDIFPDWIDMINHRSPVSVAQNQKSNEFDEVLTDDSTEEMSEDNSTQDNDLVVALDVTKNASDFNESCSKCHCTTALCSAGTIKFNSKWYHRDCFTCVRCNKRLGHIYSRNFTISNGGHPQCSECDLARAAVCHICNRPIVYATTITYDKKTYHTNCFYCGFCNKSLINQTSIYTYESKPCCSTCHTEKFSPRCFKCFKPIVNQYTIFKNQKYHPSCFVCIKCSRVIDASERLYDTDRGFVCLTCGV